MDAILLCEYNHFYRQLRCGVLTNQGVKKSTEIVLSRDEKSHFEGSKTLLAQEMKAVNSLKETIIEKTEKILACKDSLVRVAYWFSQLNLSETKHPRQGHDGRVKKPLNFANFFS